MATVTIKWKGDPPCGKGNFPYVGQEYFLFLDQSLFTSDVSEPISAEFVSQGPGGVGYDKTYTFSFDDALVPDGLAEVECCHVKDLECVSSCCGALAKQLVALKARVDELEMADDLAAPSNLAATATSDDTIHLTWVDNSSIETGFEIERSLDGSTGWIQVLTPSVNATSADNVGLDEGTEYFYRVRAVGAEGVSPWSGVASDITPPTAPSNLVATANGETQIDLVWVDNSGVETGFEVQRSLNGVSGWIEVATPAANATTDSDTVDPAIEYHYRVRAVGAGGPSGWSNVDSAQTTLAAPSNLVATEDGTNAIDLTWDDNSSAEASFEIERSPDGVGSWTQVLTPAANATSDTNTGLSEGTQYFYRIRAVGPGGGVSAWSSVANDWTLPAAPSALVATEDGTDTIDLTWSDNSASETSFEIERSPDGVGSWVQVLTPAADATADSDTGLTEATQYFYRIRAVRSGDVSAWSAVANDWTLPAAPSSLVATADGSDTIDLTWDDNSAGETGFEVERSLDGVGGWAQVLTPAADATSDSDTGLAAETEFFYRIRAVRSGDVSAWSNVDSATTGSAIVTWDSQVSPESRNWSSVAYDGVGLFVAVALSGAGRVITSSDGINWDLQTGVDDGNSNWEDVVYDSVSGLFVAVTSVGTGNRVVTSPDGITWTSRTTPVDNEWKAIAHNGAGLFVAVARTGTGDRVMTSPDGTTWTSRTSAADNEWRSVAFGNGVFVAVAGTGSGDRVMTSPDGETWTSRNAAAEIQWVDVTFAAGQFVAVAAVAGETDKIMTSPDGVTWTIRSAPAVPDISLQDVAWGNGRFVAVGTLVSGTGQRAISSIDGITWSFENTPDEFWQGVVYGSHVSRFVAVGVGGAIMTRDD